MKTIFNTIGSLCAALLLASLSVTAAVGPAVATAPIAA